MSESSFMLDIKPLAADEWPMLQGIRLAALKQAPDSFLARYQDELDFDEYRWRAEFDRGEWTIGFRGELPVSLLGCTREKTTPWHECYLEYLWVAPESRENGIGYSMLADAIARLRKQGVRTAYLWVLDGNDSAVRLYRRAGFVSSNHRQPLTARPGRVEERMHLELE
jgi:ribosomal protein S18 acetylase RimI-like enzyme